MTLEPLLNAPFAIKLHVATVVPAALIGTWQIFFSTKGAPWHRALGYIYMTLMLITATTTLWVHSLMRNGPFYGLSPIHLLIPLTYFGVYAALRGAWAHDIRRHKRAMLGVYVGAILLAGGLTFLPGRITYTTFFGN
jgi:uncharacterized membrane protein